MNKRKMTRLPKKWYKLGNYWAIFYILPPEKERRFKYFSSRIKAEIYGEYLKKKGAKGILLDHFNSDGDCIKTEEVK